MGPSREAARNDPRRTPQHIAPIHFDLPHSPTDTPHPFSEAHRFESQYHLRNTRAAEPVPMCVLACPPDNLRARIPPTGSLANMEACTSASVHFFFIAPMLANVPQ